MIVSRKLMRAVSDFCWNDQERYRAFYDRFEEKLSSYALQTVAEGDGIFLVVRCVLYEMRKIGIEEHIVAKYTRMGFAPILYYCTMKSIDIYSESEINGLVSAMWGYYEDGNFSSTIFQCLRKAADIIAGYHRKGYLLSNDITRETNRPLSEGFETLVAVYRSKISEYCSLSESTIISNCSTIRVFLYQLEQQGVNAAWLFAFKNMSDCMTRVSEYYGGGLATSLYAIKQFLSVLFAEGITADDFSITVPKPARVRVIRSGFTDGEISKMLDAVERGTAKGKRDYAILLTAAKTGLRSVDIVNLRIQDIDWRSNEVTVVQQKTGEPLMLPLPTDVGNAIADYMLNARPKGKSDKIFLNYSLHNKDLDRKSIVPMIRKYMKRAGIDNTAIPFRGAHSFRRGFGKRLLESGAGIDMINELLGHREINSSRPYLSIDENGLKKCGLGLIRLEPEVVL